VEARSAGRGNRERKPVRYRPGRPRDRGSRSGLRGIGTSPLYTEQTVFNPDDPHPAKASTENIFGVVSRIFWSVTIIVTVTYVVLVMRADNDGEGGIMALITLIRRRGVPGWPRPGKGDGQ
jgi:hypothetical protein